LRALLPLQYVRCKHLQFEQCVSSRLHCCINESSRPWIHVQAIETLQPNCMGRMSVGRSVDPNIHRIEAVESILAIMQKGEVFIRFQCDIFSSCTSHCCPLVSMCINIYLLPCLCYRGGLLIVRASYTRYLVFLFLLRFHVCNDTRSRFECFHQKLPACFGSRNSVVFWLLSCCLLLCVQSCMLGSDGRVRNPNACLFLWGRIWVANATTCCYGVCHPFDVQISPCVESERWSEDRD
jgi:hypothetical protein